MDSDDIDEYEWFEPERRKRRGPEEDRVRRLEYALAKRKRLQRQLTRARDQVCRRPDPGRPPNRVG